MSNFTILIHARLAKIMPPARADSLLAEVLGELKLDDVRSVHDMSAVAQVLMNRTGYVRYVARAIHAQAVLLGAPRVPAPTSAAAR